MTKSDLIKALHKKIDLASQSKTEEVLNAVFACIGEALGKGESLTMPGVGSFRVVERAARKGRNPQTKEEIEIPACKVVKFTVAKQLKETLN